MTPSIVILGAQKAGTSALFKMLAKHPKAIPPIKKEINFFSQDKLYAQGMRYYRSRLPATPLRTQDNFTFEASPSYLFNAASAAPRIARDLPDAYCVAVLRDPVRRAFSAWNMFRTFKDTHRHHLHDPRPFAQAVEDELAGRTSQRYHLYLERGKYSEQIIPFKNFIPEEQLLIRSYLDLKRNPAEFVDDLFSASGLSSMDHLPAVAGVSANKRPYPESLDTGLAQELYQYFAPEMAKLRKVLGYDLEIMESHD